MVNLEELYISHNGIEEIEGLDNLVSKTNCMKFQVCIKGVWCSLSVMGTVITQWLLHWTLG